MTLGEASLTGLADGPDCYVATRNMKKNPTPRPPADTAMATMDAKVSSEAGRALYKRRQQIIEPVFGRIKNRGIRSFMRRGLVAADSEFQLICATHNLLKLYRRVLGDPTVASYSRMAARTAG